MTDQGRTRPPAAWGYGLSPDVIVEWVEQAHADLAATVDRPTSPLALVAYIPPWSAGEQS